MWLRPLFCCYRFSFISCYTYTDTFFLYAFFIKLTTENVTFCLQLIKLFFPFVVFTVKGGFSKVRSNLRFHFYTLRHYIRCNRQSYYLLDDSILTPWTVTFTFGWNQDYISKVSVFACNYYIVLLNKRICCKSFSYFFQYIIISNKFSSIFVWSNLIIIWWKCKIKLLQTLHLFGACQLPLHKILIQLLLPRDFALEYDKRIKCGGSYQIMFAIKLQSICLPKTISTNK